MRAAFATNFPTVLQVHAFYIFKRYGFQWFDEALPSASEIAGAALSP
jgi:hypothetical protein